MAILWCGGEDIDFPNNGTAAVITSSSTFRSGYARCSVDSSTNFATSNTFAGGAVTSFWATFRLGFTNVTPTNLRMFGFTHSAATAGAGLWIGVSSPFGKTTLFKWDGTTQTTLASETGTSIINNGNNRIDVQVTSFGATATVNVYVAGVLVITFSGDVTVTGVTSIDSVVLGQVGGTSGTTSEVMLANEDTRAWPGLLTLALTGAGTTDQWTGLFSTINGTTFSDTSPNYTNVTAQDQQFNVTDPPSGAFAIKGVKITARMAKSASGAVSQVKLGYNSGGTVAFGTGATKAPTTAYATYEQLDVTNPVTGNAFSQSEITALQLDMQSLT